MTRARLHQFARVVAGMAADYDHQVRLAGHLDRSRLSVLGWLADRIEESHIRFRESAADQGNKVPHLFYTLRRLGCNADAWMRVHRQDIVVLEHDVESIEVAGEPAHLDVISLADDDDVIPS